MLTPEGVKVLAKNGVEVFVEQGAGDGCRFKDIQYERSGATVLPTMEKIMGRADLLLQISPPQPIEFELLNESHMFMSFYNLLNYQPERFQSLIDTKSTFISAELIQDEEGNYPLLNGMSEIAGHLAVGQAGQLLSVTAGGKGKLLAGTGLSKPAQITIIGAGKVGRTAAHVALNNGANVHLFGLKDKKIPLIKEELPGATVELYSNQKLKDILPETDVLIVSVYSLKKQYEISVCRETIRLMEEGSVVIDVSINQTPVLETSHVTSLEQPSYIIDGIVHYSAPNISASVPLTASRVITKKILSFLKTLATSDLKQTLIEQPGLLSALYMYKGKVTHRTFSERFGKEFYNIFELLELNL